MNHARAVQAAGKSCWATAGENNPAQIGWLDARAQGIILPHYGANAALQQTLDAPRYAPTDSRPTCTSVRAMGFGKMSFANYGTQSNASEFSIGLIDDAPVFNLINEVPQSSTIQAIIPGGRR